MKFQTHFADEESTIEDEFRVKNFTQKLQDWNIGEKWNSANLTEQTKKTADDNDIIFLSSPFSEKQSMF